MNSFESSPGFSPNYRKTKCILCKVVAPYTGTVLCDDCLDIYQSGALHAYGILGKHSSSPQGSPAPEQTVFYICPIEVRAMSAVAADSDLDALFSLRMFLYRISRALDAHEPIVYSPPYSAVSYVGPLEMA